LLVDHRQIALPDRHAGDILVIDQHTATRGTIESGHDPHQRGLAGLRGAEQHIDRAGHQGQGQRIQMVLGTMLLADVF
jgi:hypothetical protein